MVYLDCQAIFCGLHDTIEQAVAARELKKREIERQQRQNIEAD